jgi:hypothetical protein
MSTYSSDMDGHSMKETISTGDELDNHTFESFEHRNIQQQQPAQLPPLPPTPSEMAAKHSVLLRQRSATSSYTNTW